MAEINQQADERLSTQVSEVITKYDLLADKMDTDFIEVANDIKEAFDQTAVLATQASVSATDAAQSATQAETSLTTLENKIATGDFKGDKGDTGVRGEKGDAGAQGIQGVQGVIGEKGNKGDTGAQGTQGIQGVQGAKGDKGDTGAQGVAGPQGAQGHQGPQGPQGLAATQRAEARYETYVVPAYSAYTPAGGTWAYRAPAHEQVHIPATSGGSGVVPEISGMAAGGTRISPFYKSAEAVDAICWRLT